MSTRVKTALAWLFAVAALWWVFHDVAWPVVAGQLRGMDVVWLWPAVLCDVLTYACEGQRWSLLARPVGHLPVRRAVQAIYAGLFTNEVLPLRFGEVVRAYLASRWAGVPVPELLPSMAVGRLIDGVWLSIAAGLLLAWMPLPGSLETGAEIFGGVMLGLVLVFLLLAWHPPGWAQRWRAQSDSRTRHFIGRLLLGVGEIGVSGAALAALVSFGLPLLQTAAFWFVMQAAHLHLPFAAAAAVFVIVRLGTALPNAPANVGSFQFFTVLGLQLFGVEKAAAAAFSVSVFLVLTLPLWALGLWAILRCGVSLTELRGRYAPAALRS
jgi:uncharacterized membrane protein YbhN (UPF0104 family)